MLNALYSNVSGWGTGNPKNWQWVVQRGSKHVQLRTALTLENLCDHFLAHHPLPVLPSDEEFGNKTLENPDLLSRSPLCRETRQTSSPKRADPLSITVAFLQTKEGGGGGGEANGILYPSRATDRTRDVWQIASLLEKMVQSVHPTHHPHRRQPSPHLLTTLRCSTPGSRT